jgi:FKBP-type peptidyl-prolyl cis-trans isomerase
VLKEGNGAMPADTSTVVVNYEGRLIDGTVFDASSKHGSDPATFRLAGVIKGWQEGLQLVGEGGKIQLVIPADLAYGERGTQGIEPNSTLLFDVDVVEVHKAAPVEETPAAE